MYNKQKNLSILKLHILHKIPGLDQGRCGDLVLRMYQRPLHRSEKQERIYQSDTTWRHDQAEGRVCLSANWYRSGLRLRILCTDILLREGSWAFSMLSIHSFFGVIVTGDTLADSPPSPDVAAAALTPPRRRSPRPAAWASRSSVFCKFCWYDPTKLLVLQH